MTSALFDTTDVLIGHRFDIILGGRYDAYSATELRLRHPAR